MESPGFRLIELSFEIVFQGLVALLPEFESLPELEKK
jgi:hypothetical protein